MRYKMIVAYDGAFFHGFQRQTNLISVQSVLEDTLTEILKTDVIIHGAGRTDAFAGIRYAVAGFVKNPCWHEPRCFRVPDARCRHASPGEGFLCGNAGS